MRHFRSRHVTVKIVGSHNTTFFYFLFFVSFYLSLSLSALGGCQSFFLFEFVWNSLILLKLKIFAKNAMNKGKN